MITKTLLLIGALISIYWINIGFQDKKYPILHRTMKTIELDGTTIYAGRFDTIPAKSKYNKLGLPKDRNWLSRSEWKGEHLTGKQKKLFKMWKAEHIKNFIEYMALAVQEERMNYPDIVPSVVIAQSILESNFGKSRLSVMGNNLFGHKYHGDNGDFLVMADDDPDDKFTIYRSKWYSLRGHSKLLYKKYRKRIKGNPTADKWINALCSGQNSKESQRAVNNGQYVYATSCYKSCYQCKIKNIIKKYNLNKYD